MATLSQEKPPNPATYHNEQTSDKDAALETGLISDEERLYDYNAQPWYTKPVIQVLLVSFICFLCPGSKLPLPSRSIH